MKLSIILNGEPRQFDVPANTTLLSLLRTEAGCFSVKHGCETGECGACCVILDGRVVNACTHLAAQADEREVVTLEGIAGLLGPVKAAEEIEPTASSAKGIGSGEAKSTSLSAFQNAGAFSRESHPSDYDRLHPIQQAFVDTHAIQCGYCTPGMILSTVALFAEKGLIELPSARPKRKPKRVVKRKLKSPPVSEQEIREALAGNLCRCTGYVKPVEAVQKAAERLKA